MHRRQDRTGWTAAVLQSIAGVDDATIMANYLATNDYTADRIAATLAALPPNLAAIYGPMIGVDASYLQAGLDEVKARYGTMDNYLKQGLGLSQKRSTCCAARWSAITACPARPACKATLPPAQVCCRTCRTARSLALTAPTTTTCNRPSMLAPWGLGIHCRGQVHADAASYLLRQGAMIDQAAAPFTHGADLKPGQSRLWSTALAGYVGTDGSSHAQSSNEHSQGLMIGVTQRVSEQLSAHAGFGYSNGNVGGAGGEADTDLTFLSAGARFAPGSLERGLFIDAKASAGWFDYQSKRDLGGGLGRAKGDSHGNLAGRALPWAIA